MQIRAHIPNLLTLGNLLCGSLAIYFIDHGVNGVLAFFFYLALLLDFLDGLAARLLKAGSEMGKQLDSFADLVSFGLFPGLLMLQLLEHAAYGEKWIFLNFLALLLPVFSAIRLARFNLDDSQETTFRGLPTPANALLVFSYFFIPYYHPDSFMVPLLEEPIILAMLIILSCFLLVAPFRLFSLKFTDFTLHNNWYRYLLCVLGGVGIILFQFQAIPFIILFYLSLSFWLNP